MGSETLSQMMKPETPAIAEQDRPKADLGKLKEAIDSFTSNAGKQPEAIWMSRETVRDQFGNAEQIFGIPVEVDVTIPFGIVYFGMKVKAGLFRGGSVSH